MQSLTPPFFSIITVVYNGELHVEKTILSVINQDFNSFEYLIWDGKSTDRTSAIIAKYAKDISCVTIEKDHGVYDAMNKAVELAKGEWILFLNAGDTFCDSEILSKVHNHISHEASLNLVYGDVILNQTRPRYIQSRTLKSILFQMPFCHQSVFVNKDIFTKKKFDTAFKICADYDFFLFNYLKKNLSTHLRLNFPISVFDAGGLSYQKNVFKEYYHIAKVHFGKYHWITYRHFVRYTYKTVRTSIRKGIIFTVSLFRTNPA